MDSPVIGGETWTLTHIHGDAFEFDPNRTYDHPGYHRTVYKPHGLWLSDERNGGDDGWLGWRDEIGSRGLWPAQATDFEVDMANVLVLRANDPLVYAKIKALPRIRCDRYRDAWHTHWTDVAKHHTGVYLSGNIYDKVDLGIEETWRLTWDCASACVWDLSCLKLIRRREIRTRQSAREPVAA